MRKTRLILLLIIFSPVFLQSQTEEPDSLWNLYNLDPNETPFEENFKVFYSTGWFPTPNPKYFNYSIYFLGGSVIDLGRNINSSSWVNTGGSYSPKSPFEEQEGSMKKTFSNDELSSELTRSLVQTGFDFRFGVGLPVLIRLSGEFMFTGSLLYSAEYTKSFLNRKAVLTPLKEVNVIRLYEASVKAGAGIELPIYGIYADLNGETVSHNYYLYAGYSYALPFHSSVVQFKQIATYKEQIRYQNGRDTVRLMSEQRLAALNSTRAYIDLGLGMEFEFSGTGLSFEVLFGAPLTSVIKDDWWGQLLFGIKISVRLKNLFN